MERMYRPTPDGYCGDEDNGQTSAWYVFSSLGFYPVCPGSDQYVIGAPLVRKATITLENGHKIEISAPDNTPENCYIRSLRVDGREYDKNYFSYGDLIKGTTLQFDMSHRPNKKRGIHLSAFPYSFSDQKIFD